MFDGRGCSGGTPLRQVSFVGELGTYPARFPTTTSVWEASMSPQARVGVQCGN